jgi:hypothetical protein
MNKLFCLSICGFLFLTPLSAVLAAPQVISESQAQGETGSIPTIKLALNSGVPIKLPDGYRVYKGWLDNHTLAEIDGDRPFEQGASIVYLVGRNAGTGKLSMMVRDPRGTDHLFVMRLTTGSKSSPDMVVVKGASSGILTAQTSGVKTPTEVIRNGMAIAADRGQLIRGSDLWSAIEAFNQMVDQGSSSDVASRQSGVDLAVIERLLQLGKSSDSPKQLPVPRKPKLPDGSIVKLPPPPDVEIAQKPESKSASIPAPDFSKTVTVAKSPKPRKAKKIKLKPLSEVNLSISEPLRIASVPENEELAPKPIKKHKPVSKKLSAAFSPAIGSQTATALSTHAIANGLVRGLLSRENKTAKRGSYNYDKFQTAIKWLRRGKPLETSCYRARLNLNLAQTILKYGGIDLEKAGG